MTPESQLVARLESAWGRTVQARTREGRPVVGDVFAMAIKGRRAAAMTDATPVIVQRLWPESSIIILASGPSLNTTDIAYCRRSTCHVIAIKDAIRLAPWADVLYACDEVWWHAWPETKSYAGLKFSLQAVLDRADVQKLQQTGESGLEVDPSGLRSGLNSGHQAINLAVHLGARRIVLLGYDMQPDATTGNHHFFGDHWYAASVSRYDLFLLLMKTLVEPLARIGVDVINATPGGALECFPRAELREVL